MNLADIQGLVFRSYRKLPHASYVLLRFQNNPAAVQRWLADSIDHIDSGVKREAGPAEGSAIRLNVAFTWRGLKALGLCGDALATFPMEFIEGLGAPWESEDEPDHRSRILGDVGASRPDEWSWGRQGDDREVHAVLLTFSRDAVALEDYVNDRISEAVNAGAIAPHTAQTLWGDFRDPNGPN